jgi:thymidylate synthase (FAD)
MVLEIKAPRDISRQVLRHRSGAFQEFSQRYADVSDDMFCLRELRMQDDKNRQNSIKTENSGYEMEWEKDQEELISWIKQLQSKWRGYGAAKEVVRVLMPEGLTMSCMYVNFNVRSLVHYINLRKGNGTQLEHQDVAVSTLH